MAQQTNRTKSASFVMRLWLEPTDERLPEWRWKVHHVQTGQERYFRSLADVLEFVAGCAEEAPPQILPVRAGVANDQFA